MAEEGTTGAEKKEITREQLLAYIKKAKVKIKDLEGEVTSVKREYTDLQARHATLEEQTAEASKKEVELNDRLVRAGEEAHRIESEGAARHKELQAKLKELEAALETSRRQQDDGRDLAEKAKRAESDLERAHKALEAERKEAAKHREEAEMRIQALQEMISQATLSSGSEGEDSATVARLKQGNEDVVAKLKQVVEKAKTWQQRAKSVAEQKAALEVDHREQTEKWTAEVETLRAQVTAIECEGRAAAAGEQMSTGVDAGALDTLREELTAKGKELDEARRQLQEVTERHEKELQQGTSVHQEELSRLQGGLTAAAEERQGLEAALKEKEVMVVELQRLVEGLRSDAESRANEQQSSLHEKEQQIVELRRAASTAEEAATAAAQRAQALESALSAAQAGLSQTKEDAERLKESLDERQRALTGKDGMISSLEEELDHLRQKVTEGKEAADVVRHRLDTAQREHAHAQARAQDMQAVHEQEKVRLKGHVTEASEKSAAAQRRVRELEAEVSRLSAALVETQREEQEEQTSEQRGGESKEQAPSVWSEGLLKELEQVKAERDGAQQEATTLRNMLEELQGELQTVQATAKATTEALDTLRGVVSAQDEEVDELRASRNRWKEEVSRLNVRVKEADDELGRLRDAAKKDEQSQKKAGELGGEVEGLQAQVARLKELLAEAVKAKAGAEEELAAGQAEVSELKSQLALVVSGRDEAEAGRQAEVQVRTELQGQVQRVQQELADAVEDRQRVERDLASSQARIVWLEGEVEALRRGQAHVDDLGRRLQELQNDRQKATDAVYAECESTVKSLQDAVQESVTARREAEEALAAARSQAETLQAELSSAHGRAQRVDDIEGSVEALEKALKEQQVELASREEELAVLRQAKTDADHARTAAEAEVKRVQEQLTAVQGNSHDLAAATELAQRLEQEVADRRAEVLRLGAKVEDLSADKDAAREGLAKVQEENAGLLTQLNELRAEKDTLQEGGEVLQQELARAREEAAAAEAQAAELLAQKKEQEESVKRLKVLLSKTRSAMQAKEAELNKTRAAPQPPSAFDVTMRVRDQAGEVWCRIEVSESGTPEEKASTAPWVTEAMAKLWLSSAATASEAPDTSDAPPCSSSVEVWPAILQDEWENAAKEAKSREKALSEQLKELEEKVKTGEADFERYRMRAHSALKRFTERNGEEQRRDRLLEDVNARLVKEKGDAEDAVREAKGRAEELEKELERLKSEYDNLQAQREGLERDLEQSKLSSAEVVAGSTAEVERLRAELVEASKRLSASEAENDALEERIAELEGQVILGRTHEEGSARHEGNKSDTTVTDKAGNSPPLAEAGNGQTVMEAGEGTAGGGGLMVGLPGAEDRDCVRRINRKINTDQGVAVPPLDLGFSPMPPSPLSSRVESEEFGGLSEQYVVVKQLTSEFQAQRARDLTLIAELQDEVQDCQVSISRLQEQEKSLKAALRDVEDSLARERELHADSINADYLKQAVLGYITAANEAERLTLLSVVTTMLHFTQEETSRARSMHERGGVRGWLSSKLG